MLILLLLRVQHSAAENEAIFLNIVGPLLISLLCYYFLKRSSKNEDVESDLSTYPIRLRAKIGAYLFGILFFIAFLVGIYKGIKFLIN